jgi:hypothetical protein
MRYATNYSGITSIDETPSSSFPKEGIAQASLLKPRNLPLHYLIIPILSNPPSGIFLYKL